MILFILTACRLETGVDLRPRDTADDRADTATETTPDTDADVPRDGGAACFTTGTHTTQRLLRIDLASGAATLEAEWDARTSSASSVALVGSDWFWNSGGNLFRAAPGDEPSKARRNVYAFATDGVRWFVVDGDEVYVYANEADLLSQAPTRRLPGPFGYHLAFADDGLYAHDGDTLRRMDVDTGDVADALRLSEGVNAWGLSIEGRHVHVLDDGAAGTQRILSFDLATGELVGTVPVPFVPGGYGGLHCTGPR